MPTLKTERTLNMVMMMLGIGAALFLLDQEAPVWLRILPWLFVFGYPVWRMWRAKRS
jgi:hypothetical protein